MLKFLLNLFGKKTFTSITASLSRMIDELEGHVVTQTQVATDAEAVAAVARTEASQASAVAAKLKDLLH